MKIIEEDRMRATTKNQKVPLSLYSSCMIKSRSWRCLPIKMQVIAMVILNFSKEWKHTFWKCKIDTTYVVFIISQVIVSRSRTWTSFNSFLLISSPPNNITLEPTNVADCPTRATWKNKLKIFKYIFNNNQRACHIITYTDTDITKNFYIIEYCTCIIQNEKEVQKKDTATVKCNPYPINWGWLHGSISTITLYQKPNFH